jgi:N-acetylneuraminic acid mutarotase
MLTTKFNSEFNFAVQYDITINQEKFTVTCSCPGFTQHKYCKHSRTVYMELALVKEFINKVFYLIGRGKQAQPACKEAINSYADPHIKAIIRKYSKVVKWHIAL